MSEILKSAINHAVARTEPRRVAAIQQKTPGALGEAPHAPQPLVPEHEILHRGTLYVEDAKLANRPVCFMDVESRLRAWLQDEQLRRLQLRADRLTRGEPPTDP